MAQNTGSDAGAGAGPGATAPKKKVSKFAVPFLGFLGAVQGSAPNIASTALVGASRSLDMTGGTQALAASMQTLAVAATVVTTGLIADRIGRRHMLMIALVVGAVGNLIVMASPAVPVYLLGMAVTGVGLGAVFGSAFGYMKSLVAPERLAGAMGVFTAALMFSSLVLTFVGGFMANANWRVAYLLIPVMCAIAFVLTPIVLPKLPRMRREKFDAFGQALLGLGVVALLYSVSRFGESLTSPQTLIPLAAGVLLLAGFAVWESQYSGHFFPVELFRSPIFLGALCFGFVYNFGNSVMFLQVTNLWQYVNGLTTSKVAVWQLPIIVAGIVGGLVIGRVMGRGMKNRTAGLIGGGMTVVGFVLLALEHDATTLTGFLPGLLLTGAGVVVASVPFGNLVLREAPPEFLGPVSSSRTTFGQVFYTLGFSLSTVAIDRMTSGGTVAKLQAAGVPANQLSTGMDAVNVYASSGTQPTTSLGKQALADAVGSYGTSFRSAFFFVAVAILVVTGLGVLLLRTGEGEPKPAHPEGTELEHEPT